MADNTRFLIPPWAKTPNLAARVLSLPLRRLSSGMEAALGRPALVAKTFVDPLHFEGACCRALNWVEPGETRGCARSHGERVAHGQPKRVFAHPLSHGAREALRGCGTALAARPGAWHGADGRWAPPSDSTICRALADTERTTGTRLPLPRQLPPGQSCCARQIASGG